MLRGFTPLLGTKVEHTVAKHSDVGGGHCGGTCGHIFGFRRRHSNGGRHGKICFDESTVVENHVSDDGAASVRAVLPTGVREDGESGLWDSMVKADVVDGIKGAVGIELRNVVEVAMKVANEPGESLETDYPRGDACFCKFADSKMDISPCVVRKEKKSSHGRVEG